MYHRQTRDRERDAQLKRSGQGYPSIFHAERLYNEGYAHLSSVGRARDCNWIQQAYLGVACSNQAGESLFFTLHT